MKETRQMDATQAAGGGPAEATRAASGTGDATIEPQPGMVLRGAYRLDDKLGEGGMGAVYKGIQLTVEREVAIKLLRPAALKDPEQADQLRKRFEREAKLTSRLEHPNTVRLIDYGDNQGMLFLVLELLRGNELGDVMRWEAPLEPRRVAHIGRQICLSLAEAHGRGIVHRDLKPDNVFLCEYGNQKDHVKVVDFGIARMVGGAEETGQLTSTGLVIGTPKYMAPEQVQAQPVSPQTDLYALGVMLYEMLIGEAPFKAESIMALAFKHVHEPPPRLPDEFGPQWQSLLEQLLAKDPASRGANADAIAARLEAIEMGSSLTAMPHAGSGAPDAGPRLGVETRPQETLGDGDDVRTPRRKTPVLAIAAAVVLIAGGVGAFLAFGGGGNGDGAEAPAKTAAAAVPEDESSAPAAEPEPEAVTDEEAPDHVGETESGAEQVGHAEAAGAGTAPDEAPGEPVEAVEAAGDGADEEPAGEAPGTAGTDAAKVAAAAPVAMEVAAPPQAHLTVATRPEGATIWRGDTEVCTTPCDVDVPAGRGVEVLVAKLDGYQDEEFKAPLGPDDGADVELKLDKVGARRSARKPHRVKKTRRPKRTEPKKVEAKKAEPKKTESGDKPKGTESLFKPIR